MKKYSKAEKLAAVLAVEAGEGVKVIARRLQINREVLRHAVGMYREHGEEGLSGKKEGLDNRRKIGNSRRYASEPLLLQTD